MATLILLLAALDHAALAGGGGVLPMPADLPDPAGPTLTPLADYNCDPAGLVTLLWHPAFDDDPGLQAEVREAVIADLAGLRRSLPASALDQLGDIRVAIAPASPAPAWLPSRGRRLGTHRSIDWLVAHGLDADRAGVIEVYNAADYLAMRDEDRAVLLGPLTSLRLLRADADTRAALAEAFSRAPSSASFPAEHHYATALTRAMFAIDDLDADGGAGLLTNDPAGCSAVARLWGTACTQ